MDRDLILPDLEGSRVAFLIRSEPGLKDVPIVFLTGVVTKEEEASETGGLIDGIPFLAKPVTAEELLRCVDSRLKPR